MLGPADIMRRQGMPKDAKENTQGVPVSAGNADVGRAAERFLACAKFKCRSHGTNGYGHFCIERCHDMGISNCTTQQENCDICQQTPPKHCYYALELLMLDKP
jgi:hypothetical protein